MNAEETTLNESPILEQPWEDFDAVLRHAERARLADDPKRAHAFYARAIELDPNEPRGWAGLAATAPSLDETIISWAYALALKPDFFDARLELDAHVEQKIDRSGIADAAVLVALGRTLAEVGQRAHAYRLLLRATELDPTNEESWIWRAGVTENNDETIACLNQVLAMNPTHAQALAGLKWAEARTNPTSAASPEDSVQAAQLFEQGQDAMRLNQPERAHALFVAATERDPQNERAWFWRGSTTTDTNEALLCMERAHALCPNDSTVNDALWWLRIKKLREEAHGSHPPIRIAPEVDLFPTDPDTSRQRSPWLTLLVLFLGVIAVSLIAAVLASWVFVR